MMLEVRIDELLRRLGSEAILHEAESHGLAPRANRLRCPFEPCAHKGPQRERDAVVFAGGHPRIHCYACSSGGDLLDLLQRTRGITAAEALAHVQGQPVSERPAPQLRVIGSMPDESGKMSAHEVRRIWDSLATTDDEGRRYLEGRQLEAGIEAGLVRFCTDDNRAVSLHARRGHRLALLLTDVTGNPRGIQLRLTREARAKEQKVLSIKGSVTSRAFFGEPGLIEAAPVVCVTEGLADTLAVSLWVESSGVVVGAAGKSFLPKLAEELEAAGIAVDGKLFVLFPQNDRPKNESRREFTRLAQLLSARGASIAWVQTPDEWKDVADWRKAVADLEWPVLEVVRAMAPDAGLDVAPALTLPPGHAVALPAKFVSERYDNDLTTLCALLDDSASREALMGRGELTFCEMTQVARIGGRPLLEVDLAKVRIGLEQQKRSSDGKPLRFSLADVASVVPMLASRKTVHPVREWLTSLKWDGVSRTAELAVALGQEPGGFSQLLLRRWLLSAVARVMVPGCKVDAVLVLVGPQGAGKSTFFSELGKPWHTDSHVDVADKDGKLIMRKAWIVEWAELDSMRRSRDQEAVKAFLSARVDVFRAPYARDVIESPRHCVIVGTTNHREFLFDVTGSRRFWPVETAAIDLEWVRQHREQLWAEALSAFRAGEQWWLTPAEDLELARRNRGHEAEDVWTDPVRDWLDDHRILREVTVGQVLKLALDRDVDAWSRADEMRVAVILKQLGWTGPVLARRDGTVLRLWQRPEVEQ